MAYLFLDTKLQDDDLAHISRSLKLSAYSLSKLERILMDEVLPVCIPNMQCVGGEWAGFDETWLHEAILASQTPNIIQRRFNKARFWMIKKDWDAIVRMFKAAPGNNDIA